MRLHANAALSLRQRERMVLRVVEQGWPDREGRRGGRSERRGRCSKWVARYRAGGPGRGCSIVRRLRGGSPTAPTSGRVEAIAALRRLRFTGPEIAEPLGMPLSTVSAVLKRRRDGQARPARTRAGRPLRARAARRADPHRRQEARPHPRRRRQAHRGGRQPLQPHLHRPAGKRRNTVGWEYVHIAVDDATRLAYAEVLADEKASSADRLPAAAPSRSSNATASGRDACSPTTARPTSRPVHAIACRALGIRHLRTRPYRPQTNGKAERFIRTMLAGWAYGGAIYRSSQNAPPPLTAGSGTTTIDADTTAIGRQTTHHPA